MYFLPRRHDEVAAQRQVAAEPGGGAVHRGDGGLGQRVQQRDRAMRALLAAPPVEAHLVLRRGQALLHAAHVAAGAEGAAGAGDDQGAHRGIGAALLQRRNAIDDATRGELIALRRSGRLRRSVAIPSSTVRIMAEPSCVPDIAGYSTRRLARCTTWLQRRRSSSSNLARSSG